MVNNAIDWQATMQRLQCASSGSDLRDQLIEAIKLCHSSHSKNVNNEDIYYADIWEWNGVGPLPNDWIIDEQGRYVKEIPNGS